VLLLQLPLPAVRIGSVPKPMAERKPEQYKLPEGAAME
jgi:hypothetical protein